jgi:hypothetical protein
MNKATLVVSKFYANNRIFDLSDSIANRDNCLYPFYALKEKLAEHGYDLATQDINRIADAGFILYNEMPRKLPANDQIDRSFLLLFESELIRRDNWDLRRHDFFRKIFTWHDEFINKGRYVGIRFSMKIPEEVDVAAKKSKLITMIAGNKSCEDPRELYSERVKTIRWFERYHPDDFDLFGIGWNKRTFKGLWSQLNRIDFLRTMFYKSFPSYRGAITSKYPVLRDYSFCICYENARDIPGYITEKIFDCLFAGCVPVYWGAPNVNDHIPNNAFISRTAFNSHEDLYEYLKNMGEKEYRKYLRNIRDFVKGDKIYPFSSEHFVQTITQEILSCLQQ